MVPSRFANMSDEDMEKLENTKNAINVAWKVFEQYIVVKTSHKAQLSTRYSMESLTPDLENFAATFEIEAESLMQRKQ